MGISEVPLDKFVEKSVETAKQRAKEREGKERRKCTITKEQMQELWETQSGICAVSGQQMTRFKGHGNNHIVGTNASIDRIDSMKGYTIDNVQWVCWTVNRTKGPMDERSFFGWCSTIVHNALYEGKLKDNRLKVVRR
jgi:hypothetical protein